MWPHGEGQAAESKAGCVGVWARGRWREGRQQPAGGRTQEGEQDAHSWLPTHDWWLVDMENNYKAECVGGGISMKWMLTCIRGF